MLFHLSLLVFEWTFILDNVIRLRISYIYIHIYVYVFYNSMSKDIYFKSVAVNSCFRCSGKNNVTHKIRIYVHLKYLMDLLFNFCLPGIRNLIYILKSFIATKTKCFSLKKKSKPLFRLTSLI